ncbi:MAG: hypothetical protein M1816_004334 [Peltula sp. TS41687]|nr:MAG: hypothetical protein M1816_004334 [Peltula sp. TS41687]
MPADQLLATLLRALHHTYAPEETSRLLSTAASVLVILTNPLNVTLLTSHLLTAPAIWSRPDGLSTCLRVLQTFHSATRLLEQQQQQQQEQGRSGTPSQAPRIGGGIPAEEWIQAVIKGADARSPRWRHLLPIGGLLLGIETNSDHLSTPGIKRDLVNALVEATNLALQENKDKDTGDLPGHCITSVWNYTFELVPEARWSYIDQNALLPVLIDTAFFSSEGFHSGYFLGLVDADVVQSGRSQFTWPAKSPSYLQLEKMASSPLMSSMGPLSRLIGNCLEAVHDPALVYSSVQQLALFARSLATQWRQNKLSEIDVSEETTFLDTEAFQATVPLLWKILQNAMFAAVNILKTGMSRTVAVSSLAADNYAPFLAMETLHTLRHLFFISSRLGPNSFSSHVFVFLTAIDILSHYPEHAQSFLTNIRPRQPNTILTHPLDRSMDHFFLNTAEHFTLILPPTANEELIMAAAIPYLKPIETTPNMTMILEAAHSVMLAVLSAPQNMELTARTLPFYLDILLESFPQTLSARQFRLAFKTLIRLSSPPSPLSIAHPDKASTLLEILRHRVLTPSSPPPPSTIASTSPSPAIPTSPAPNEDALPPRATLVLTIIDSLPYISPLILEEWLYLTAELMHHALEDEYVLGVCTDRFWNVLSGREMDVERAQMGVAWWAGKGGREMVLFGQGAGGDGDEIDGDGGVMGDGARSKL